jgi:hypothetical protein
LKKDVPFKWEAKHMEAMDRLAQAVTENPVLQRPNYDKPFFVEVDASQFATGAVLTQKNDKGRMSIIGSVS